MPQPDTDGTQELGSVRRAFEIIEYIDENDGLGVSELSKGMEIPKSTAHIYLKTLANTGFLVKDSGTYKLSLRFLELGGRVRKKEKLFEVAREEIEALSDRTGEVASVGVEENGQRVLLYKSEGQNAVYDKVPIGERTNLHWTALGKAILAFLPMEHVDVIINRHGLPKLTEQTITTREELLDELETIQDQGYSLEDEERRPGIQSIGVPIRPDGKSVVGSISLTGPKSKLGDELIEPGLLTEIRDVVNVVEIKYQHY